MNMTSFLQEKNIRWILVTGVMTVCMLVLAISQATQNVSAQTAPAAPTAPFISCDINQNVTMNWQAPAGGRIDHYRLQVDDMANGLKTGCASQNAGDICLDQSSTQYFFKGVVRHTYRAWVQSVNADGTKSATLALGTTTCPVAATNTAPGGTGNNTQANDEGTGTNGTAQDSQSNAPDGSINQQIGSTTNQVSTSKNQQVGNEVTVYNPPQNGGSGSNGAGGATGNGTGQGGTTQVNVGGEIILASQNQMNASAQGNTTGGTAKANQSSSAGDLKGFENGIVECGRYTDPKDAKKAALECDFPAFLKFFQRLINYVIILAVIGTSLIIAYNGWEYMRAGDKPGDLSIIKDRLWYMVIGIAMMLGGWLVFTTLANFLLTGDYKAYIYLVGG